MPLSPPQPRDEEFMRLALEEARKASEHGDVPIGAVVVSAGEVLAAAHNERERRADPTAHAEILALRAAGEVLGTKVLDGTTAYVTLEPCPMCAGALSWRASSASCTGHRTLGPARRCPSTTSSGTGVSTIGWRSLRTSSQTMGPPC